MWVRRVKNNTELWGVPSEVRYRYGGTSFYLPSWIDAAGKHYLTEILPRYRYNYAPAITTWAISGRKVGTAWKIRKYSSRLGSLISLPDHLEYYCLIQLTRRARSSETSW